MNVMIRVLLERIEIDFWRLQENGVEIANRIALATWAAVREVDGSVEIASHGVEIITTATILGETCLGLMNRYIKTPDTLGIVDLGVAFYSRPVQKHQRWINVILERVFGQDTQVFVKVVMGIDSGEVPLDALAAEVGSYMRSTLGSLGLRSGTDDPK